MFMHGLALRSPAPASDRSAAAIRLRARRAASAAGQRHVRDTGAGRHSRSALPPSGRPGDRVSGGASATTTALHQERVEATAAHRRERGEGDLALELAVGERADRLVVAVDGPSRPRIRHVHTGGHGSMVRSTPPARKR